MARRIPIFRKFTDEQFKPFGLPNGEADEAFIAQVVKNTNFLIEKKLHIPPLQETHDGAADGVSAGWFDRGVAIDGDVLLAEPELTPRGKQRIGSKEFRHVSSSLRKDFKLPDGSTLPGPYLHHVALVNNPRIKGLVDLAEVQFSEDTKPVRVGPGQADGEVVFLAEFSEDEENTMLTAEEIAALQLKAKEADTLKAQFDESETKRKEVEAKLTETEKFRRSVNFAETARSVKAKVDAAQKEKLFGASASRKLTAVGLLLTSGKEAVAEFADVIKEQKIEQPGADPVALFDDLLKALPVAGSVPSEPIGEEYTDENAGVKKPSKADFSEAHIDPKAGDRVANYVAARQKTNPKFTIIDAKRELFG